MNEDDGLQLMILFTRFEYNIDGGIYQTSSTFTVSSEGSHLITVRSISDNTCVSPTTTVNVYGYLCAITETTASINGTTGGTTPALTGNDTLNGVAVTIDQVNLTVTTPATSIGGAPVPVIDIATGQISVPVGTPAGTYTIVYSICDKLNPTNCDSATVTITVIAPIVANDDSFVDIDGTTGNSNPHTVFDDGTNKLQLNVIDSGGLSTLSLSIL